MAQMKKVLSFLLTAYVSVPVLLYLFPWILSYAIFSHLRKYCSWFIWDTRGFHWQKKILRIYYPAGRPETSYNDVRFPYSVDLRRPQDVLNHTCNFYLSPEEGVSVGVWHTLPASQWEAAAGRDLDWYQEALGDGRPVIIYLHGNVGTRAISHRVELVKILSAAGYHVLSLDYRGFGDSSGEPSEAGLTNDALYLHHWAKTQSRGSLVCLWGHSLGSGVATNAAVKIQEQGSAVDAVVLEAPYTRIGEAVANNRLAKLYMFLPGFESLLWNILERINISFSNVKNLETLSSPLLILHAEDDNVVPFHMGQKLYQISLRAQREPEAGDRVQMVSYGANLGLSHSHISSAPDLADVVQKFLKNLERER